MNDPQSGPSPYDGPLAGCEVERWQAEMVRVTGPMGRLDAAAEGLSRAGYRITERHENTGRDGTRFALRGQKNVR